MPVICSSSVIESALLLLFTGLLVFHFGNYYRDRPVWLEKGGGNGGREYGGNHACIREISFDYYKFFVNRFLHEC
jgi:hypothetical protein